MCVLLQALLLMIWSKVVTVVGGEEGCAQPDVCIADEGNVAASKVEAEIVDFVSAVCHQFSYLILHRDAAGHIVRFQNCRQGHMRQTSAFETNKLHLSNLFLPMCGMSHKLCKEVLRHMPAAIQVKLLYAKKFQNLTPRTAQHLLCFAAQVRHTNAVLLFVEDKQMLGQAHDDILVLYESGQEAGIEMEIVILDNDDEHSSRTTINEMYAPMPCKVEKLTTKIQSTSLDRVIDSPRLANSKRQRPF